MRSVIIAYSPTASQVGKQIEVDDEQAATLVREGRARYADQAKPPPAAAEPGRAAAK